MLTVFCSILQDLSRLEASIEKYSKEASRIRNEDSSRWIKRFKEAGRDLDILKREIAEQGMSTALDVYLQKKTVELENAKLHLKTVHVHKINSVYQNELDNWNKVVIQAAEIIQQNFLLLRSMGELDNGMLDKLQRLGKLLQGERSVKFVEMDAPNSAEANDCLNIQNIMHLTDYMHDESHHSPISAKKRLNEDEKLENEAKKSKNEVSGENFQFLRPKALKSINFGSAPLVNTDHDMNVTFDLNAPGPSGSKPVLIERSNRPATSSGAIKSKF